MKSNKTVLHYTVQDGNVSLLRYFLELNAFKCKDFVNNKVIFINKRVFFLQRERAKVANLNFCSTPNCIFQ